MRSLSSALLLAAAAALVLAGVSGDAAAAPPAAPTVAAAPAPTPCAGDSDCWKGSYLKTSKKPIKAECCEQMEGSILCTKVGDDDALVEFGPGDCRYSKNRRQLKCEKACGSGCSHKFDGSR
jgi:hypothetical protein